MYQCDTDAPAQDHSMREKVSPKPFYVQDWQSDTILGQKKNASIRLRIKWVTKVHHKSMFCYTFLATYYFIVPFFTPLVWWPPDSNKQPPAPKAVYALPTELSEQKNKVFISNEVWKFCSEQKEKSIHNFRTLTITIQWIILLHNLCTYEKLEDTLNLNFKIPWHIKHIILSTLNSLHAGSFCFFVVC